MLSLSVMFAIFRICLAVPVNGPRAVNALALDAKGVDFIASFEGFRANFYTDAAVCRLPIMLLALILLTSVKGVRTIGYGHACQSTSDCSDISAPITEAQGKSLLNSDANAFEACVNKDVTVPVRSFPTGKFLHGLVC